jgi:hypothetical protein
LLSASIAALLAVEISVVAPLGLPMQRVPVLRGIAYDRDQGQALWQARIAAQNSWVRSLDAHG